MFNSIAGMRELLFGPMILAKDKTEYERLLKRLHDAVKELGDYDSRIDGLLIDRAVRAKIYLERCENLLDRVRDPTEIQTITDAVSKWNAILRHALKDLAANRKERLKSKSGREIVEELERFIEGCEE